MVASAPFFPNLTISADGTRSINNFATSISNLLCRLNVEPLFNCLVIALLTSGSEYPNINGWHAIT